MSKIFSRHNYRALMLAATSFAASACAGTQSFEETTAVKAAAAASAVAPEREAMIRHMQQELAPYAGDKTRISVLDPDAYPDNNALRAEIIRQARTPELAGGMIQELGILRDSPGGLSAPARAVHIVQGDDHFIVGVLGNAQKNMSTALDKYAPEQLDRSIGMFREVFQAVGGFKPGENPSLPLPTKAFAASLRKADANGDFTSWHEFAHELMFAQQARDPGRYRIEGATDNAQSMFQELTADIFAALKQLQTKPADAAQNARQIVALRDMDGLYDGLISMRTIAPTSIGVSHENSRGLTALIRDIQKNPGAMQNLVAGKSDTQLLEMAAERGRQGMAPYYPYLANADMGKDMKLLLNLSAEDGMRLTWESAITHLAGGKANMNLNWQANGIERVMRWGDALDRNSNKPGALNGLLNDLQKNFPAEYGLAREAHAQNGLSASADARPLAQPAAKSTRPLAPLRSAP